MVAAVGLGTSAVIDVARTMAVAPSRASTLVGRAIGQGLVTRAADQWDGRAAVLRLSPAGRAMETLLHESRRDLAEGCTALWEHEDVAARARLLTAFVDAVAP